MSTISDIVEIEDTDSEIEVIDDISRSTSTSQTEGDNERKRKRCTIIEISDSEEDLDDKLRELSVEPRAVPKKRGSQATPNQRRRLTWIRSGDRNYGVDNFCAIDGRSRMCHRIRRDGFILDGMELKVDNAVVLPHQPPMYALIRSITTCRSENRSHPDKHIAHVHFLKPPGEAFAGRQTDQELFLKHGQCQDIALSELVKGEKLDFALLPGAAKRVEPQYFCRYVDHPSQSAIRPPFSLNAFDNCDSCYHRHEKHKYDTPVLRHHELTLGGERIHLLDFLAIDPKIKGEPYLIGRAEKWRRQSNELLVTVRLLKRISEVKMSITQGYISSRRLVLTDRFEEFPVCRIMEKVQVLSSEEQARDLKMGSSFWCNERLSENRLILLQKPIATCEECLQTDSVSVKDLEDCLRACKFAAADYYSGAGGFILPGLEIFDWVSANDFDKAACQTLHGLRRKAPRLKVHHGQLSSIHKLTLEQYSSQNALKVLPFAGSVFLMTGGPPCQGHSRVNISNNPVTPGSARPMDSRNDELWVMLKEVYRLQPFVVIIENVAAFKDEKGQTDVDGAESNYARAAMKDLARNGYSCRLGLLDSRSYGSPQNRLRLFILAVKGGLPLPEFPSPTHANPKVTATLFGNDKAGRIQPFYIGQRNTPGTALHPAVSIEDAISDLPPFEYVPPPGIPRLSRRHRIPAYRGERRDEDGKGSRAGPSRARYAKPPQNEFQAAKRGGAQSVHDHHTSYITESANKMVCWLNGIIESLAKLEPQILKLRAKNQQPSFTPRKIGSLRSRNENVQWGGQTGTSSLGPHSIKID
uniref:DNA (cytosine-5-)-methyltransferase n=1 Tax=Kwoniella dejecticola CBS 10117 TaxID=1296121 RepID=A0A1A6AA51_9TREE|nr:uncharacterized protein I303_02961 [Kwoniella dejecticola CBS 10117]OBR86940.1 hypothetical protein I303_02961 [Kwoniella dejecticola CBS 10117]